jgi:hypothetical protein
MNGFDPANEPSWNIPQTRPTSLSRQSYSAVPHSGTGYTPVGITSCPTCLLGSFGLRCGRGSTHSIPVSYLSFSDPPLIRCLPGTVEL